MQCSDRRRLAPVHWRPLGLAATLGCALLLGLPRVCAADGARVALVIGNGAYTGAPRLANAASDARAVAAALTRLGFSVETVNDGDRAAMEGAVRRLGDRARGADAVIFFYAGHALQAAGRNFLLPVSAAIREERDLRVEAVDFDDVLAEGSNGARLAIYLLDSCRDNPFRKLVGGAGGARSLNASPGLASVNAATGTLIVFATDPGNVAEDGLGTHSPFTTALLEHIEKPGLEIRQIMALVRGSVRSATKGRQIPWKSASLEGDFYLHPIAGTAQLARAGTAETSSAALDRMFWESVKDSGDTAELEAYLARFPDGVFAPVARARLTRVRLSGPSAAGSATPTAASPAKPSSTAPGVAATATVGGNPAPPSANSPPTARAAFDPDKVPFAKSREDLRNYSAYKGDKALALGASGVSWWMPTARQALEACEFWSREPCLLYAVGNWVEPAPDGRRPVRPTLGPGEGNFDRERVPFVSDGVRASLSVYVTAQNPKALAISPNGIYGLAADSLSMEETQRVALDRCLAAERDHPFRKPCFLYAVDDWVVLAKRATAPLVARKRFNPETVPITVNRSPARTYMNLPEEKAFAISPSGKHHWYFSSQFTRVEAQRLALEGCEFDAREPCFRYATNDEVEPTADGKRTVRPLLPPDGGFDPGRVPFASDATRDRMEAYSDARESKAVSVSPFGKVHWATADGTEAAQAKALALCRAADDKPCYVYAVGGTVVLSRRATAPIPASSLGNAPSRKPGQPRS